MIKPAQRITVEQAKAALLRSGYLIEGRIESLLVRNGYYVEANDAYRDPSTDKSREIDLFAITARQISRRRMDFVFNVLLIECVNNPQPLVLLTKPALTSFLFHEDVRVSGLPVKVLASKPKRWVPIQEAINLQRFHHYCTRRVATQFCSFSRKSDQDWFAQHEGSHFDSFQKLCDCLDYFQAEHYATWTFSADEPINIQFYYPILILQGELLEARATRKDVTLTPARHLQYRRPVVREGRGFTYQIDVVTEAAFPRLLRLLDIELDTIMRRIKANTAIFDTSIRQIVSRARRLRSPEAIRRALEQLEHT